MSVDNRLRFVGLWLPVIAYIAFIFWLSSAPRTAPSFLKWPGGDKAFHTVEYAGLGVLLLRALNGSWPSKYEWGQLILAGWFIAMIIGGLDEYYQQFTPTRSSSVLDWSADAIGALMGQILYWLKVSNNP